MQNARPIIIGVAAVLGAGTLSAAQAQEGAHLGEIIVTAQKIAQNIVDVPISMTVLDAGELAALRVKGIEDFAFQVPNVTFRKGSRDAGPSIAIRGVSGDTGGAFSPTNVTVDDIPYAMISPGSILTMRSFDLERVDVLRGPQGTLTGANALGGIFGLVTAKPELQTMSGDVTAELGRYDYRYGRGMFNAPLGDSFAVRGVLFVEESDGVTRNVGPAGGSSSVDNKGGRIAARWQPSEALTIDVSYTHEEQEYGLNDHGYIDQFDDGPNSSSERRAEVVDLFESVGGSFMNPDAPFWYHGADNNRALVSMDYPEGDRFDHDLVSLHAEYDFGNHKLNFLYGYYDQTGRTSWDADRTEFAQFSATVKSALETNSAELRVTSDYGGKWNWVAGVAYHDEFQPYEEVGYMAPSILVAWGELAPEDVVGDPNDYSLTDYAYKSLSDLTTKAVFANVFYDITDRLHLSAGLRYTSVEAEFGAQCCGDDFGSPRDGRSHDQLIASLDPITMPSGSSDEINPRIALSYDISDSATAYVQYATGFRPGTGNDPRVIDEGLAQETADPEYVENYEIGIKANLLGNRLYLGVAAFYMDYSDLQVGREAEIAIGGSLEGELFLDYTANAGKARVQGFELEAQWRATDALSFNGGVGYSDSVVQEFDDVRYSPALDMPGVRPWTAILTADYRKPVGPSLTLNLRADYRWQDEAWVALFPEEQNPGNFLPSWETLDLSAGLDGERWSLLAYYENVLDETYYTGQTNWSFRPTVYFMPRGYGARFVYRFGD